MALPLGQPLIKGATGAEVVDGQNDPFFVLGLLSSTFERLGFLFKVYSNFREDPFVSLNLVFYRRL